MLLHFVVLLELHGVIARSPPGTQGHRSEDHRRHQGRCGVRLHLCLHTMSARRRGSRGLSWRALRLIAMARGVRFLSRSNLAFGSTKHRPHSQASVAHLRTGVWPRQPDRRGKGGQKHWGAQAGQNRGKNPIKSVSMEIL